MLLEFRKTKQKSCVSEQFPTNTSDLQISGESLAGSDYIFQSQYMYGISFSSNTLSVINKSSLECMIIPPQWPFLIFAMSLHINYD